MIYKIKRPQNLLEQYKNNLLIKYFFEYIKTISKDFIILILYLYYLFN